VHHCEAVRIRRGGDSLLVFGFSSDLDLIEMLYTSLLVQALRALAQAEIPSRENARTFRTSWWAGYTSRIITRLRGSQQRAEAEAAKTPGTALVLADRSLQVKAAFRAEFPKTRTTSSSRTRSRAGYSQGHDAGGRADIGGSKLSARSAGALTGR